MKPELSPHFQKRKPSVIRTAQIEFHERRDAVEAINVAIGNVSLPMHPAMIRRLADLQAEGSPFQAGAVRYTPTVGVEETHRAFRHIIASSGFETDGLYSQITDGASQAMELLMLGVCRPVDTDANERPLFLIDAAYTNYNALTKRLGCKTVSVARHLNENGKFSMPDINDIEEKIELHKPGAMVDIPYDNPTGHFTTRKRWSS